MIPSLEETTAIIVLILPGFFAITIGINFYGFTRSIPQFDKLVWSILISGVIDTIFFFMNGLFGEIGAENFGKRLSGAVLQPVGMVEVFLLSLLFGVLIALILRVNLPEHASRLIHYRSKRGRAQERLSGRDYYQVEDMS